MKVTKVWLADQKVQSKLPLIAVRISAGFPSPGADYMDKPLDLNELMIRHPKATYYMRVEGDSMKDAGIFDGDILIVDCAEEAVNEDIVIASLHGDLLVKKYHISRDGKIYLMAANDAYPPIQVEREMQFEIWGVVTWSLHQFKFKRTARVL